jgi:hypothetical protein
MVMTESTQRLAKTRQLRIFGIVAVLASAAIAILIATAIAQDWRTPAANPKLKPEEVQCQPMKRNPVGPLIKISSMAQSSW